MSMATSTLRAIILVAAVVIGILLIGQAFGSSSGLALRANSPSPSASASTSPSPSPSVSSRPPLTKATAVKGVPVQVLNGTSVDGLAAVVALRLKKQGYSIGDASVANAAVHDVTRTIIYYAKGARPLAAYMQQHYLHGAQLKPAGTLFKAQVKLTVLVGTDQSTT
jgi:hypothetical protein